MAASRYGWQLFNYGCVNKTINESLVMVRSVEYFNCVRNTSKATKTALFANVVVGFVCCCFYSFLYFFMMCACRRRHFLEASRKM